MTGPRIALVAAALAAAASVTAIYHLAAAEPPPPERPETVSLDAVVKKIDEVSPGTVVGKQAPAGWSHLVLKSEPSIAAADRGNVSSLTADMATFVFTATLADVASEAKGGQKSFYLKRVGLGIGADGNGGRDIVMTPDTQRRLGGGMGFLKRRVFKEIYKRQGQARLAAATRTMALLDTIGILRVGGGNRRVILRYALLADPATGKLSSFVWAVGLDGRGKYTKVLGKASRLPKNAVNDAKLVVDTSVPLSDERRFGLVGVPAGATVRLPAAVMKAAGRAKPAAGDLRLLELMLRKLK